MTREDRTLLALIAVFAPARAEPLLDRLGVPGAERLRAEGGRLSREPRSARLLALDECIALAAPRFDEWPPALGTAERERTTAVLQGAGALRPALHRILLERLHSAPVRSADRRSPGAPSGLP